MDDLAAALLESLLDRARRSPGHAVVTTAAERAALEQLLAATRASGGPPRSSEDAAEVVAEPGDVLGVDVCGVEPRACLRRGERVLPLGLGPELDAPSPGDADMEERRLDVEGALARLESALPRGLVDVSLRIVVPDFAEARVARGVEERARRAWSRLGRAEMGLELVPRALAVAAALDPGPPTRAPRAVVVVHVDGEGAEVVPVLVRARPDRPRVAGHRVRLDPSRMEEAALESALLALPDRLTRWAETPAHLAPSGWAASILEAWWATRPPGWVLAPVPPSLEALGLRVGGRIVAAAGATNPDGIEDLGWVRS